MMMASNTNLWLVAGLVYALAGSALLCNAVFLNPSPLQAANDAQERTLRRLGAQWLDTRVGAVLLVAGFFLQATGALGSATLNTPAIFILLGLAFAASLYAMTKDLVVEDLITSQVVPARNAQPIPVSNDISPSGVIVAIEESKIVDLRSSAATG